MPPTRTQLRWSGRLRTGGAVVALLGGVALADAVFDLASPQRAASVFGDTRAPLLLGVGAVALGAALFWLGRRWRGH